MLLYYYYSFTAYRHNCECPASGKSGEEAANEEEGLKSCGTLGDPRRDVDAQPATQRGDAAQLERCQATKVVGHRPGQ